MSINTERRRQAFVIYQSPKNSAILILAISTGHGSMELSGLLLQNCGKDDFP